MAKRRAGSEDKTPTEAVPYSAKDTVKELTKGGSNPHLSLLSDSGAGVIPWWCDTGAIGLDWIIGQGVPGGRLIEIYSNNPSEGKTTIAASIVVEAQKAGHAVLLLDSENGTLTERMISLGVDPNNLLFHPEDEMEHGFTLIKNFIDAVVSNNPGTPITVVWDSIGSCPTKAENELDFDQNSMALQARVLSKCLKQFVGGILGPNSATLVCTNQSREKIGAMYGPTTDSVGGKGFKFYAHVRISLQRINYLKDANDEVIGITVKAKAIKNKVSKPFREVELKLMSADGIDKVDSEFFFAFNQELIKEAGKGYFTIDGETKFRRKDYLANKPAGFDEKLKACFAKPIEAEPTEEVPENE